MEDPLELTNAIRHPLDVAGLTLDEDHLGTQVVGQMYVCRGQDGGVVIRAVRRERPDSSRLEELNISRDDIPRLPEPKDREILALLVGAGASERNWWPSERHPLAGSYRLDQLALLGPGDVNLRFLAIFFWLIPSYCLCSMFT